MNPTLKGVAYVSVWVMLWGTASSLADFVLLQRGVYAGGTIGQGITFAAYGIASPLRCWRCAWRGGSLSLKYETRGMGRCIGRRWDP